MGLAEFARSFRELKTALLEDFPAEAQAQHRWPESRIAMKARYASVSLELVPRNIALKVGVTAVGLAVNVDAQVEYRHIASPIRHLTDKHLNPVVSGSIIDGVE